jgi:hypothetical protein
VAGLLLDWGLKTCGWLGMTFTFKKFNLTILLSF